MKCVYFQLQVSSSEKLKKILQRVDLRAPIPQALEGGDGNGGLWQCILDENKVDALVECLQIESVLLYTPFQRLNIESDLYLPLNKVIWRFGKEPTIEEYMK